MNIYLFVHLYLVSAVGHTARRTVAGGEEEADRKTDGRKDEQTSGYCVEVH